MFFYLGVVGSIVLLNAVQWFLSRDSLYGLFTLQTFPSFLNAALFSLALTNLQRTITYDLTLTLLHVSYIAFVDRFFHVKRQNPRLHHGLRVAQWLLLVFLVMDLSIDFTQADRHHQPLLWLLTVLTGSFFLVICLTCLWVAAQRHDLIGRFFLVGSFLVVLDEARALISFSGVLWISPVGSPAHAAGWLVISMVVMITLELLCFSVSLLLRQRQLAVEQAQREAQLVQEHLEAKLASQQLEQEKTAIQLRALQAQVNPHFLFNSLNSLASLIEEDAERAERFVNELSQVYRYLLTTNDEPLTTLAKELNFIQAYYQLLKTRFGEGLALRIEVKANYEQALIPPLTLQLLLENAVKHNIVSPKQPLQILIFTTETAQLVVSNTLQRKRTGVLSNGVGLSTIRLQLESLKQPEPVISEINGMFQVALPLIDGLVAKKVRLTNSD